ncbi:MAG TPA: type VII secretion integral membrane protein EccD [Amycolatopsis sp.]|nr:type VII secretion integral membrane protein EccD [Amycolatopsis sp.]
MTVPDMARAALGHPDPAAARAADFEDPGAQQAVAGAADLARVSVHGPGGRVDLSVPAAATIGGLLPLLVGHVGGDGAAARTWTVQRLGEPPLPPEETAGVADLSDGDVLYLRATEEIIPPIEFDDLPDGVATAVNERHDRWTPEATRKLFLGLLGVGEVGLAAAVVSGVAPGPVLGLFAGIAAVLLGVAAALAERLARVRSLGLVLGFAAFGFAGLAGLLLGRVGAEVLALRATDMALAGCFVLVVAVGLAVATCVGADGPLTAYGTVAVTAAAIAVGSWLSLGFSLDAAEAASIVAVGMFLIGTLAPRIAARLARLRVPHLPHNAKDLQEDIDPEQGERLAGRVALADAYLGMVIVSGAILFVVDALLLVREPGWAGRALPVAFATAMLLRARSLRQIWQRGSLTYAGGLALVFVVLALAGELNAGGRVLVVAVLVAGLALTALGAWRLPAARLRPVWGHAGDVAELWTAIALLPLLLQVLHIYAYFRSLAG